MSRGLPIMSRHALLGVAMVLTLSLAVGRSLAAAPDWRLVWEDDFESFDNGRWEAVKSFEPTNNSLHAYLPSQVAIEAGKLVITSTDKPIDRFAYRSGLVASRESRKHGRWEVRAKLPTTPGMWPAIWLLPEIESHQWPSGGEIDIMEARGNQPNRTSIAFHYGTKRPYRHDFVYAEQQTATLAGPAVRYDQGFHTYAVDWTSSYLRFYVDGVHHKTVHDEDVDGFLSRSTQPMQLIFNTAIGGDFLPGPDDETVWPQEFQIDSVRVYELSGKPGDIRLTNPGFEQNAGSLAGWSLFGGELYDNPNVRVAKEAVLDGVASLKVFGLFRSGLTRSGVSRGITVEAGESVAAELSSLIRSADALVGENRVAMKIVFFDEYGAKHGSSSQLGEHVEWIVDAATATDVWATQRLEAVAPEGAEEARFSIVFEQPKLDTGAIHIDEVSFAATPPVPLSNFRQDE